jgi:hypothetical protein
MQTMPARLQAKQNGTLAWSMGSGKRQLLPNVLGNLHVDVGNDTKRQRRMPGNG